MAKRDPERAIDRRESWSRPRLRIERKLLAQGKFKDCLFTPAPEQGEDGAENGSGELQENLHGDRNPAQCQASEQDCSCYRVCSILAGWVGAKPLGLR
jgi:hypothetical protein